MFDESVRRKRWPVQSPIMCLLQISTEPAMRSAGFPTVEALVDNLLLEPQSDDPTELLAKIVAVLSVGYDGSTRDITEEALALFIAKGKALYRKPH